MNSPNLGNADTLDLARYWFSAAHAPMLFYASGSYFRYIAMQEQHFFAKSRALAAICARVQ